MSETNNDSFNAKMIAEIKKMQAELNELKNSKEPTKKTAKKRVAKKPAKKTTKKDTVRRK